MAQVLTITVHVNFLDLNVACQDGVLSTCLYWKPTATNNLLEFRSFHPSHTKKGIPVGQFLRTRRNCTRDEDFYREAHDLTKRFKKKTYPNKYISQAYQRAKGQSQVALLQPRDKILDKSVHFITGFNTHWSQMSLPDDHRDCPLYFLYAFEMLPVFPEVLIALGAGYSWNPCYRSPFIRMTSFRLAASNLWTACGAAPSGTRYPYFCFMSSRGSFWHYMPGHWYSTYDGHRRACHPQLYLKYFWTMMYLGTPGVCSCLFERRWNLY
ncbi:uncharacterized protein [Ranitomeya imitator]|uniref:uncharacterized protein n=1 Tax=Ranitomeya imitator TaxID=111125 RepID=UPI0037E94DA6